MYRSRIRLSSKPCAAIPVPEVSGVTPIATEFLTGQLLLAMPQLRDAPFQHAVILICVHNADGALGICVNRPLIKATFEQLLAQLGISPHPPVRTLPLHEGGPVDQTRGLVLHSTDWAGDATLTINGDLALTGSLDVLQALADGGGPRDVLFALGHAGWGRGQLEREIAGNSWLTTSATDFDLIFGGSDGEKWRRALATLRVDPGLLSDAVGHA